MAVTFSWKVTGIKTRTLNDTPNIVVQTYWEKIGTDENGNTGTFAGATPFTIDSMPEGTTFIPFEQLTEEDVLTWIKAVVVGHYQDRVNLHILNQIGQKINPVVEASLPWASNTAANTAANTSANTANT